MEVQESPSKNGVGTESQKEVHGNQVIFSDQTDAIILPKGMSKRVASKELLLQSEEEEKVVDKTMVFEEWEGNDALVATMRVVKRVFGWINGQATQSMFGSKPPRELKVKTGVNQFEDCFLGDFLVASWEGAKGTVNFSGKHCYVNFTVKKKFSVRATEFFTEVEKELKRNSIYKNKCLIWREDTGFDYIENKGTNDIILNKNEQLVLDKFILKPIRTGSTKKVGILMAGPFGTGKTETALMIGREAVTYGQTFIYCKDRNLSKALAVAKRYQPSVLFIEDLDEITSGGRDETTNDLLNTIDGIETKGQALTLIMTTNNKDNINPAFRRPGRIDIIMEFSLPEADTIATMYRRFFDGIPGAQKLDYTMLAGNTPNIQGAMIREIANRAILLVDEGEEITNDIVESAVELAKMQINFMSDKHVVNADTLESHFLKLIDEKTEPLMDKMIEMNSRL